MTEVEQLYDLIKQHHGALTIACRAIAQSFSAMADLCVAIGATQNDPTPESEPESSTIPTEVRPPEMGVHKPSTVPPALRRVDIVTARDPESPWYAHTVVYADGTRIAGGTSGQVEPEDASLDRDFAWTVTAMKKIAECAGATVQRHSIETEDDPPNEWPPKRAEPPPIEGNEIATVVASTDHAREVGSCSTCDTPSNARAAAQLIGGTIAEASPDDRIKHGFALPGETKRSKTDMTASQWATSKHFLAYVTRNEPFNSWTAEEQNAKRDAFVAAQPTDLIMNRWGQRFAKFCGVA